MSIASRARQVKRPTGDPKRVRHARPKPAPFNFTEFVKGAHTAVVGANKVVLSRHISGKPTPGAFGGPKITRASRLKAKLNRLAAEKALKDAAKK
jgi:hypothetical protein